MANCESGLEENFGLIQPTVIQQLRTILDQYPDDGQILKELIQNAEDAGARQIAFVYDKHTYGKQRLYQPELAKYQGPGLLAYNDASFSEEDWTGIRLLCESIKKQDPLKIGRFGLGFKSVFHMTDLPSVISGQRLLIIDPHEELLDSRGRAKNVMAWNVERSERPLTELSDQFSPFLIEAFGCTAGNLRQGRFSGTLFRFPLRRQKSELSSTIYDDNRVEKLFHSFETDAYLVPLFLKKVEKITLCYKGANDGGTTKQFIVQLAPSCVTAVRAKRAEFLQRVLAVDSLTHQQDHISTSYEVTIETHRSGCQTGSSRYLVRECYACGEVSTDFRNLRQEYERIYKPMVGVAMPLRTASDDDDLQPEGQTFCVLPLPKEKKSSSGLPVHVNGYFSVSQNRRHLKWKTAGQEVNSDNDVAWNHCLLNEVLPQCYAQLISDAIAMQQSGNQGVSTTDVYAAIPDLHEVDEKWKMILADLFHLLLQSAILHTRATGGRWLTLRDSYLDDLTDRLGTTLVRDLLVSIGYTVVTPPSHVLAAIDCYSQQKLNTTTPQLVRNAVKQFPDAYVGIADTSKFILLKVILQDMDFTDLEGIRLLPLDDGTFGAFQSQQAQRIYIPSDVQRTLLPGLEHILIRRIGDTQILGQLAQVASSGYSCLKKLEPTDIPTLVRAVLSTNPGGEWFEALWGYLLRQHPTNLTAFEGMEILPLTSQPQLQQPISLNAENPQAIMVEQDHGERLSSNLCSLMNALGIWTVDKLPRYVKIHPHVVGKYIKLPTAAHVTDILLSVSQQYGSPFLVSQLQANQGAAEEVVTLLAREPHGYNNSYQKVQLLRCLPLFQTTQSTFSTRCYASVLDVPEGVANYNLPITLPCVLLLVQGDSHRSVAKALGVQLLTITTLFKNYLIPHLKKQSIPVDDVEKLMKYVFDNMHTLVREDQGMHGHFSNVPFVQTLSGKLMEPRNLFDPQSHTLQLLFSGEQEVFPSGRYAQPGNLALLSKMGLKTESGIDSEDISHAILTLGSTPEQYQVPKATAVLTLLSNKPHLLSHGSSVLDVVQNQSWVPVVQERPSQYPQSLPWAGLPPLRKPADVVAPKWGPITGSTMAVVAMSVSSGLEKLLGWNTAPQLNLVVEQLLEITRRYRPAEKAKYLSLIMDIYRYMHGACAAREMKQAVAACPNWVWIGDAFASPGSVVFRNSVMDLQPFVYVLPGELQEFRAFFSGMGVHDNLDGRLLVDVLHMMEAKYSEGQTTSNSGVRKDLQMTIDILNYLREEFGKLDKPTKERTLVPVQTTTDKRLVLLPVKDCTYCDTEWIRQIDVDDSDGEEIIMLVHRDLPMETAVMLGVPRLINRVLHADGLQVTAFGQSESLTNRISHLLEDYTDGLSIIKEMIQNADDAGAKTVKFLYDERTNEDAQMRLLDPEMKECQGAALWVHNDAIFTKEDFANIASLGNTSKEVAADKVGQFGLGFNAVYNLTDVPSFISDENIVMFDPQMNHLRKVTNDTGVMINIAKNRLFLRSGADQFKPFWGIFGCDLSADSTGYPGTLFRLPLRTAKQAETSTLCKSSYDKVQMIKLLRLLELNSHQLLLFTQNVQTIELHHLPERKDPGQAVKILSVERTTTKTIQEMDANSMAHNTSGLLSFVAANVEALDGTQRVSEVLQTKKTLLPGSEMLIDSTPKGTGSEELHWLVSTVVGDQQKLECAERKLAEFGGLAMSLKSDAGGFLPQPLSQIKQRGQIFCGLPLPVFCDLPVHINATFALHSSRRGLIQTTGDDINKKKFEWNNSLMQGVLTEAYLYALEDALTVVPQEANVEFYPLWPGVKKLPREDRVCMDPLVQSFYSMAKEVPLWYSPSGAVTLMNAVLVEAQLVKDKVMGPVILETIKKFLPDNTPVTLPEHALKAFIDAGQSSTVDEKKYNFSRYYREVVFPNLKEMEEEVRVKHMSFAVDVANKTKLGSLLSELDIPSCVDLLNRLQQVYGEDPLEEPTLRLTVEILVRLGIALQSEKRSSEDLENDGVMVFMPNQKNVLMPSTKLCYSSKADRSNGKVNIVSSRVLTSTVRTLGVKSRREYILDEHSMGIPFGQTENLTNAIRRVLESYPRDHEILKELIQNADDAGATKIHFIYDQRKHSQQSVFSEAWKQLQGPALCVYNNSPFTEKDLQGIQQFGVGAKGHDATKTGQYGIGFSSVYHLTDVPSVLTSGPEVPKTLCVFDPHCRFVPGANAEKPGRRYQEIDDLKEEFPDVFQCYLEEFIDTEDATLIRLPLRNEKMANDSSIWNSKPPDMKSILHKLIMEAPNILLFVNHLKEIEVSEVSARGQLSSMYKINASVCSEDSGIKQMDGQAVMAKMIEEARRNVATGDWEITDIPKETTITALEITDSKGKKERWFVAQTIGIDDEEDLPQSVQDAIKEGNLALLPRGGVAAPVRYLQYRYEFKGQVFCFLPMPLPTKLPVHVNGHFALGHENRRHLWTNSDAGGYKKDWNDFLCEKVISRAYVELLEALKTVVSSRGVARSQLESQLLHYQAYFPVHLQEERNWQVLVTACYQLLASTKAHVLPVLVEMPGSQNAKKGENGMEDLGRVVWQSHLGKGKQQVFFPESPTDTLGNPPKNDSPKEEELRKAAQDKQTLDRCLLRCGFKLLHISEQLTTCFETAGVPIQRMSPTHILEFFAQQPPLHKIGKLPAQIMNTPLKKRDILVTLLKYCSSDEQFQEKLDGLPLLLTNDHTLRQFDASSPVYHSKHAHMLDQCAELFLEKNVLRSIFHDISKSCTVMKTFDIEAMSTILHRQLPHGELCVGTEVKLQRNKGPVSMDQLTSFWKFIEDELKELFQDSHSKTPGKAAANGNSPKSSNGGDKKPMTPAERKVEIARRLEPVKDWCLIPTLKSKELHVVAICKADMVLGRCGKDLLQEVYYILQKCGVHELQQVPLPVPMYGYGLSSRDKIFLTLPSAVTTTEDVPGCLNLLHCALAIDGAPVKFGLSEAGDLLDYFSENVNMLKDDESAVGKLTDLPLYYNMHKKLTQLTGYAVNIVPTGIPPDGIEMSQQRSGNVFLLESETLKPLYAFLGCKDISIVFFYCSFVFQHFEYFSDHDRMVHLRYLYSNYFKGEKEDKAELIEKMKETALITDNDGDLQCASHFYDQDNSVFAAFKADLAPPKATSPFTESSWKDFLEQLGLVTEVTLDVFLECARIVEEDGKASPSSRTGELSELLMDHAFTMGRDTYHGRQNFMGRDHELRMVCRVRFIRPDAPSDKLKALCPLRSADSGYMELDGAIDKEHEELVWTQVQLLPTWANPMHAHRLGHKDLHKLRRDWGIQENPAIGTVLAHLQTLGEHLHSNVPQYEGVALKLQVFKHIYQYLQNHSDECSRSLKGMSTKKCIIVDDGARLVAPCQIARGLSVDEQIKPLLYKVPDSLTYFGELLLKMGATEVVSIAQYMNVLETLYHHQEDEDELSPNQMKSAFKAVKGLFKIVAQDEVEFPKCKLYLPGDDGNLILSTDLVYNDVPSFFSRIEEFNGTLLVDLIECGLEPSIAMSGVEKLPLSHQPRLLSSMIEEVLVSSTQTIPGSPVAQEMNTRIQCAEFHQAVQQLLMHEKSIRNQKIKQQNVADAVNRLTVCAVDEVKTVLRKKQGGSVLKDSARSKPYHVKSSQERDVVSWTIYIDAGTSLEQEHLIPLARIINTILGGQLRDTILYLLPLLTCPKSLIADKLEGLNVQLGALKRSVRRMVLPQPGAAVEYARKRKLVDVHSSIEVTDYVGYTTNGRSMVVYAIVRGIVTDHGNKRYRLDVGDDDPVVVGGEQIMAFNE